MNALVSKLLEIEDLLDHGYYLEAKLELVKLIEKEGSKQSNKPKNLNRLFKLFTPSAGLR